MLVQDMDALDENIFQIRGGPISGGDMAVSILYPSITIRLRGSPRELFRKKIQSVRPRRPHKLKIFEI